MYYFLKDLSGGLKFSREDPSDGELQFLDLRLNTNPNGLCWGFQQRSKKPVLPFGSNHSKTVKTGIEGVLRAADGAAITKRHAGSGNQMPLQISSAVYGAEISAIFNGLCPTGPMRQFGKQGFPRALAQPHEQPLLRPRVMGPMLHHLVWHPLDIGAFLGASHGVGLGGVPVTVEATPGDRHDDTGSSEEVPAAWTVTTHWHAENTAGATVVELPARKPEDEAPALQQPASFHGPPVLDSRHPQGSHRGPGQQPYNYWRSRQDVDVVGDFEVIDCHQEDDACCCCGAPVVTPPSTGGDNGPGRRQEHRASRVTLLTTVLAAYSQLSSSQHRSTVPRSSTVDTPRVPIEVRDNNLTTTMPKSNIMA
ncbi:hypothetical protein HPB47_024085 [Ixodes persulcatus]|uniref:Uncharacterized protein n=1 Tax=Ixodes persulcatus TaxID=34615 RepID=A0AC60Q781_IXOPE|nr:hypothetical protein HPB47_024085 [Ixodes persulcatus]